MSDMDRARKTTFCEEREGGPTGGLLILNIYIYIWWGKEKILQ